MKSQLKAEPVVPLASMADIALLLVIFFMLTSTFAKDAGFGVSLPTAASVTSAPPKEISLWIDKSGRIFLRQVLIPLESLQDILGYEFERTGIRSVTIRADKDGLYGNVVKVMDTVNALGGDITLAVIMEEVKDQ